jgi:hypothetical protein
MTERGGDASSELDPFRTEVDIDRVPTTVTAMLDDAHDVMAGR